MDLQNPSVSETGDIGLFGPLGNDAEFVNESRSKHPSPHWPEWLDGQQFQFEGCTLALPFWDR